MIDQFLKKYVPRLLRGMHREFVVPVDKQKKKLHSLGSAKDDFERSYFQFKCQELFWGVPFYFVASTAALVLMPVQLHKLKKTRNRSIEKNKVELVLIADEMPDGIFPTELVDSYSSSIRVGALDGYYFSEEDEAFFRKLQKRYWKHPYFLYKCLMKQAGYSYVIQKYDPKVICACGGEFTYTSSYLTSFCNTKNVKHYNTMHGEMFFYVLDAFVHFDRFYVWDDYYKDLLVRLKADSNFIVALPPSVRMDLASIDVSSMKKYNYKYYLQMQDGEVLRNIASTVERIRAEGYSVCVRYHPRTVNLDEIKEMMPNIVLENPRDCNIGQSIKIADNIVGLNSTVLFQSYKSGKKVIIDDVSNPELYAKLIEMEYMMIHKCEKLSSLLK